MDGFAVFDRPDRRKHAIIEQVNADLKDSALAHMPSGLFAANSAWLVATVMAYNLARRTTGRTETHNGTLPAARPKARHTSNQNRGHPRQ